MAESLLSLGLDVGTTSTQMVLSRLTVENKASPFAVPALEIVGREVIYRSKVHFTPLIRDTLVDGEALKELLRQEYEAAGIRPEQVDTGALIITGETSRKENAAAAARALAEFAGEFVVTTAGPDLESILAAKGAGAVELSEKTGKPVLHMDIGGGTSNLALIRQGAVVRTGCLNVGGRLIKLDKQGILTYVSPELSEITSLKQGKRAGEGELEELAEKLTEALEMAAGLREKTSLLERLMTREAAPWACPEEDVVISFSGGVADCIEGEHTPTEFGDLGVYLGRAIRKSRLCWGDYRLGRETIRATVIGAGCHSTQLSGSTVFTKNVRLPLKDLPVARITYAEQEGSLPQAIRARTAPFEGDAILALPGYASPSYGQVKRLAEQIAGAVKGPVYLCLEQDMAKALGQAIAARLEPGRSVLCLDRVAPGADSYLDVGAPLGPALPVVVKTLIVGNS